MKIVLAAALALLAGPALAQGSSEKIAIDVGKAAWDKFPTLAASANSTDYAALSMLVSEILASGKCTVANQSAKHFDITVPYAAMVEPDGKISRILVSDIGCRPIEELVGYTVLTRARSGEFTPTGQAKARWYAGELNTNLE